MKNLILILSLVLTTSAWAQNVVPSNRSQTKATQPTISATFQDRVHNVRVWVDGTDFTRYARTNGNRVSLVPPYALDYGVHQVKVKTGTGELAQWAFAIGDRNLARWDDKANKKYKKNKKHKKHDDDDDDDDDRDNRNYKNNGNRHNNGNRNNNGVIDASRYGPAMGSVVTVSRPPVSVAFSGPVQNLKMVVDGRDVTRETAIGSEGISWVPRSNLNRGQHSVTVTGNALNGQPVNGNWHFFVEY